MAIFEGICPRHSRFEVVLPALPKSERVRCPECGYQAEWVPSLVAMRPDTMWSGVVTSAGHYYTSRSKFDADQRAKRIERITSRRDLEAMHKMVDEGKKSKKEKASKVRRKVVEEALRGVDDNQLRESAFDANGRFKGSPPGTIDIYSSGKPEGNHKEVVKGK